jgi:hypothetical protein
LRVLRGYEHFPVALRARDRSVQMAV